MNHGNSLLLMTLAVPLLSLATKPPPFHLECRLLDRVSAVAGSQSPASNAALVLLRQVALGREAAPAENMEAQVEAKPGELQKPEFRAIEVRVHALRCIGRIGNPEAVAFLSKLTPGDLGPDRSQEVWPAAQIALREALLTGIADQPAKTEFLENVLTEKHDAMTDSKLVGWAINQLCDSGTVVSLPVIQEAIRKRDHYRGEQRIQFCEARMRVIRSDPDRAKALGSGLKVDRGLDGDRLMWWAIGQLDMMQSQEADAELDRFAAGVAKLPDGSAAKQQASVFGQAIRDLQALRPHRRPSPTGKD